MTRKGFEGAPPQGGGVAIISGGATAPLAAVTGVILLWIWVSLLFGAGLIFKSIVREEQDGPVELVLFPVAVLAGVLLRPRLGRLTALPGRDWRPLQPLVVAGALLALFAYLGWTWAGPAGLFSAQRILGAVLIVTVAFAAAAFHPRLMGALAGAIAAPALFGLAAYMVPDELIRTIGSEAFESGTGRNLGPFSNDWYHTDLSQTSWGAVLYHLMRWVGYWGPPTLLGASLLSFLLRRHALGHACWAGAVALLVGTGQFYLQMVGEGFGR